MTCSGAGPPVEANVDIDDEVGLLDEEGMGVGVV